MNIQEKIEHIVVLMLENRSFDNLVGWLYNDDYRASHFLPNNSPNHYAGLAGVNYSNPTCFASSESENIAIKQGTQSYYTPSPDPNEHFNHMNRQLFGDKIDSSNPNWLPPNGTIAEMNGFLVDYTGQDSVNPQQIMETYTPEQLPVISSLARNFAISDNYHASCPTQTWPNRAFMYAGTSLGRVNNAPYTPFNVTTLFNVLSQQKVSWKIYRGAKIAPSLTRLMMFDLWPRHFDKHFSDIDHFLEDCHSGTLPALSFLEPTFLWNEKSQLSLDVANSAHPPSSVYHSEVFLSTIANAIIESPRFDKTLFIVNYDEHGGTPDHIAPNWTAIAPDSKSQPGEGGFYFNRFGVRVPLLMISPYIQAGTVFRANSDPFSPQTVPFDHTTILALILDWQNIARSTLSSKRVLAANTALLDQLLTLDKPRTDISLCQPVAGVEQLNTAPSDRLLSSLEKSIIIAYEYYRHWHDGDILSEHIAQMQGEIKHLADKIHTINDARKYLQK